MGDSLTSVNCGNAQRATRNAQRATRNKQRETPCRPIALSDCRSFLSDASSSRLAHCPCVSDAATDLLADRPALSDASTRLPDDSLSLRRCSADLLNDCPGLLYDSTAVLNHSPRLPNRCKLLKIRFLAENGQKLPFCGLGRARHSVRAAHIANPRPGGQRADRPTFRVVRVFRGLSPFRNSKLNTQH